MLSTVHNILTMKGILTKGKVKGQDGKRIHYCHATHIFDLVLLAILVSPIHVHLISTAAEK